jgi:hypothetical protein
VAHIAGEEYDHEDEDEETFRDRSALTARFRNIDGVVAADGALYIADTDNHRIRKLHDGVVSTLSGPERAAFGTATLTSLGFTNATVSLSTAKGVSWWRISTAIEFELSRWRVPRQL